MWCGFSLQIIVAFQALKHNNTSSNIDEDILNTDNKKGLICFFILP